MSDGGSPLTLLPVKDVVIDTDVMSAVNSVINDSGVIDGGNSTAVDKIRDNIYDKDLYDLTGRKIKSMTHQGIYISNGKKVYHH